MAQRGNDVFITFAEFSDWVRDLTQRFSLVVLLDRGPSKPLDTWDGEDNELSLSARIFLATDAVEVGSVTTKELNPAERGWVVMSVPRTVGSKLLVCQLGARSDWWDPVQSTVRENPAAIRLYDKVWKRLKTRLTFPVWGKNVITGAASPYRSMGYSQGAKEWTRSGGILAQEGVANIEYEIRVTEP
jgi:hypothetical protein